MATFLPVAAGRTADFLLAAAPVGQKSLDPADGYRLHGILEASYPRYRAPCTAFSWGHTRPQMAGSMLLSWMIFQGLVELTLGGGTDKAGDIDTDGAAGLIQGAFLQVRQRLASTITWLSL